MADPPLWLLDVDGVLNAVCDVLPPGYKRLRLRSCGVSIRWNPVVIERISALHRAGAVEVRWLTTWGLRASDCLAPALDLPLDCVVEGEPEYRATDNKTWWKARTAKRLSDADPARPLIWTDDDLEYATELGEVEWLHERTGPTLVISPDPEQGLTVEFLDRIEAFAERCRSRDVPA